MCEHMVEKFDWEDDKNMAILTGEWSYARSETLHIATLKLWPT
jgi:hypothetical protein